MLLEGYSIPHNKEKNIYSHKHRHNKIVLKHKYDLKILPKLSEFTKQFVL